MANAGSPVLDKHENSSSNFNTGNDTLTSRLKRELSQPGAGNSHIDGVTRLEDSYEMLIDDKLNENVKENRSLKRMKSKSPPMNFRSIPFRSKFILLLLSSSNFAHLTAYSLMAPFYPIEAAKKGMSQSVIGLIFSTFEFIVFCTSPLYGAYLVSIGPRFMFTSGIIVGGVCAILFGLLEHCPSGGLFITMSFLTRLTEALGMSAFTTASFAIASNEFPDHIATVFAMLETATSLGFMVGPVIGSVLYEAGGFGLPFYVIGAFILFNGVLMFRFLPQVEAPARKRPPAWNLARSSLVWISMLTIMFSAFGIGFIDPNMSLHISGLGIPEIYVGFVFIVWPVMYACTAPIWGYLSDQKGIRAALIIGGNITCGFGFLLIGPTPLLPFLSLEVWLLLLGLVLCGISNGCAVMPTMKCLVLGALEVGFKDSLETFGMVAGVFNAFYCLGSFMGPALGSAMVDSIGFNYTVTVIAFMYWALAIVSAVYFFDRRRSQHKPGYDPLVDPGEEGSIADDKETSARFNRSITVPRQHTISGSHTT